MIDFEQARQIAMNYINDMKYEVDGDELILADEHTMEKPYGWVFFYTSRRWRGGDFSFAIAGNAPFIIDRKRGDVHVLGTALPVEEYLGRWEEKNAER